MTEKYTLEMRLDLILFQGNKCWGPSYHVSKARVILPRYVYLGMK